MPAAALRRSEERELRVILGSTAKEKLSCATQDPVSANTLKDSTQQVAFHKCEMLVASVTQELG